MQKKNARAGNELLETYLKQIKVFNLLSFDEELALSKQIKKGNKEALHKLINSNLRLVVKIATMYRVSGISVMDFIQEGNIGLLYAAEKYDFQKNVRFCTYASWWIRQFITRYISDKRRMVRLPQRKEDALRRIQQTYHLLCQTLMRQPKNSDIAKELGLPVKVVDSYFNLAAAYIPFDYAYNNENTCPMDFHEDYTYNPEIDMMKQASREGAMRILERLKENERRIINYRYQLNGSERHTLREIGNKLDISPESVRQIEIRALRKIRNHAEELRDCLHMEAI